MYINSYCLKHPIFLECLAKFGKNGAYDLVETLVNQSVSKDTLDNKDFIQFLRDSNVILNDVFVNISVFLINSSEQISLVLKDGTIYQIDFTMIDYYQELFPSVFVDEEFKKMVLWFVVNSKKRKSKDEIEKFIYMWLSKASTSVKRKYTRKPKFI